MFEPKLRNYFLLVGLAVLGIISFVIYGSRKNGASNLLEREDGTVKRALFNDDNDRSKVDISTPFYATPESETQGHGGADEGHDHTSGTHGKTDEKSLSKEPGNQGHNAEEGAGHQGTPGHPIQEGPADMGGAKKEAPGGGHGDGH